MTRWSPIIAVGTSLLYGCPAPAPAPDHCDIRGRWELVRLAGPPAGPSLELAIDSVSGGAFAVSVTGMMVGNVGIPPSRFTRTTGRLSEGCRVHIRLREDGADDPVGVLDGTVRQDTMIVHGMTWVGVPVGDVGALRMVRRRPGRR